MVSSVYRVPLCFGGLAQQFHFAKNIRNRHLAEWRFPLAFILTCTVTAYPRMWNVNVNVIGTGLHPLSEDVAKPLYALPAHLIRHYTAKLPLCQGHSGVIFRFSDTVLGHRSGQLDNPYWYPRPMQAVYTVQRTYSASRFQF